MNATTKEFLAAWAAWDEKPLNEDAAKRMETAARAEAENYAMTVTQYRDLCASWRRAGCSREQAWAAIDAAGRWERNGWTTGATIRSPAR